MTDSCPHEPYQAAPGEDLRDGPECDERLLEVGLAFGDNLRYRDQQEEGQSHPKEREVPGDLFAALAPIYDIVAIDAGCAEIGSAVTCDTR